MGRAGLRLPRKRMQLPRTRAQLLLDPIRQRIPRAVWRGSDLAHRHIPRRSARARLETFTQLLTNRTMDKTTQKLTAVIDAIDAYRAYAVTHAVSIANDAVSLFRASEDEKGDYPEVAEYKRLRDHAEVMVRDVLP